MTLEEYFKTEFAEGKIDHCVRAHVHRGVVEIYIHPHGKDGQTTPPLVVEGDCVRPKFFTTLPGTVPIATTAPLPGTVIVYPLGVTAGHVVSSAQCIANSPDGNTVIFTNSEPD